MRKQARLEARSLFVRVRTWPVRGAIFWMAQQRLLQRIGAASTPVRSSIVRSARARSSARLCALIQPRRRAVCLNASLRHSLRGPWTPGQPLPLAGRWNTELLPLSGRRTSGQQLLPLSDPRTSDQPPPGRWSSGWPPAAEHRMLEKERLRTLRKRFRTIR